MICEASEAVNFLAQAIFDKKGLNILALDAREFSSLADYFVIAEGRSDRHLGAISDSIIEAMRTHGWRPLAIEGRKEGEWIAIDFGAIIVHLFSPGWREKYALEELWRECQIVDFPLVIRPELSANPGTWEGYE